jgi:hypothetical protein
METIQPEQPIIQFKDGRWIIPNPQEMDLIQLAHYAKKMINEGDIAVVEVDEARTRTFDFGALQEKPPAEVNGMLMGYAKVMQKAHLITAVPPNL